MTCYLRLAATSLALCLLTLGLGSPLRAQTLQTDEKSIREALARLKDEDDDVARQAADRLVEMGPSVVPFVEKYLSSETDCSARLAASYALSQLDPANASVISTLRDVTLTQCYWSPERDIVVRREAAMLLAVRPEGVDLLATILTDSETFNRQSAVFAFDDLTESLQGDLATPEMLSAVKRAIPALRSALHDLDERVRVMAREVLEQLSRSDIPMLKKAADEALRPPTETVSSDRAELTIAAERAQRELIGYSDVGGARPLNLVVGRQRGNETWLESSSHVGSLSSSPRVG